MKVGLPQGLLNMIRCNYSTMALALNKKIIG